MLQKLIFMLITAIILSGCGASAPDEEAAEQTSLCQGSVQEMIPAETDISYGAEPQ